MADGGKRKGTFGKLVDRAKSAAGDLLVARRGPLTRDLLLTPGAFGLGKIPERLRPDQTTTSVCGFCSTGCGLEVHLKDGQAINLTPRTDYPVNLGMACPKGWEALTPLAADDRATQPLMRPARDRKLAPTNWDTAISTMVTRFKEIQAKHGKAAVAFISTGQIVTEEMALLGALAKFGMGMVHGDGNTRQCMATAAVSYKQSFGFDAPPFSYDDFEQSDVIVLIGSNLCIAHPIMWERVCRNPHQPHVIVVDPRKTETAMAARTHLALRPKSDLTLLYAIAHVLIEKGWIDRAYVDAHTQGFEALRAHVAKFPAELAAEASGLSLEQIEGFARAIHEGKRVSFWWTMGVNQSHEGTRLAQAIINLALLTGNIGRPGTGANSITGQCNAMGSRLFSNTTNLMGGHDFLNPAHRDKVAQVLGIDEAAIPRENSVAYDQIFEKILSGQIKGLWIIATNPAHSWINQGFAHDILSRLDYLVVQDMYSTTETAAFADLLLPAAGWGEKEGTFINSERRIGLTKKVSRAPGQALADFHIFRLVAEAWGCGDMFKRWTSPEAVFQILKELSSGQPCDITGITDYAMLERERGVQWPLPAGTPLQATERRLFEDGRFFHADGRARLIVDEVRPVPEPTTRDYPLTLLTGRGSSSQWHTQTRTGKSAVLRRLSPQEIYVEVNPADAEALGMSPNEWVNVVSRRATVAARAFVTQNVKPGQIFIAMHYQVMNRLTFPAFDPHSRQPAYKAAAVRLERIQSNAAAP
jgi:anaerobic selenocysteine-containing dehydrogenase